MGPLPVTQVATRTSRHPNHPCATLTPAPIPAEPPLCFPQPHPKRLPNPALLEPDTQGFHLRSPFPPPDPPLPAHRPHPFVFRFTATMSGPLAALKSLGVPLRLLREAEGHAITAETEGGDLYRGHLASAEDSMNVTLTGAVHTARDGRVSRCVVGKICTNLPTRRATRVRGAASPPHSPTHPPSPQLGARVPAGQLGHLYRAARDFEKRAPVCKGGRVCGEKGGGAGGGGAGEGEGAGGAGAGWEIRLHGGADGVRRAPPLAVSSRGTAIV